MDHTRDFINQKFAKKPEVIEGNMKALECAYDVVEAAIEEDNQISA